MIRDSRFHRGRYSQGCMDATKVVVAKIQGQHRMQLAPLFAEGICQSGQPSHAHSHIEILSLNVRRTNLGGVRIPIDRDLLCPGALGGRITLLAFARGNIDFNKLCEVNPLRP